MQAFKTTKRLMSLVPASNGKTVEHSQKAVPSLTFSDSETLILLHVLGTSYALLQSPQHVKWKWKRTNVVYTTLCLKLYKGCITYHIGKLQYNSIILTVFQLRKLSLNVVKLFGQGYAEYRKKNPFCSNCMAYAFLCYVKLSSTMSSF